jgi:Tat protein secretion system quality control protein TatD with DNase activity
MNKYIVEFLAELKGVSTAELANKTTDNFFRLFTKAIREAEDSYK